VHHPEVALFLPIFAALILHLSCGAKGRRGLTEIRLGQQLEKQASYVSGVIDA
jgi:hypothetical protein